MAEVVPRLKKEYEEKIRSELQKELGYDSPMAAPNLEKIVVNSGLGEATDDSSILEEVSEIVAKITGQKPVITKARTAISAFGIKKGAEVGVKATLRGKRMWFFFDKLINIVFPRTRDFRGKSPDSFDDNFNYSIGIEEHIVFPEIDPTKFQKSRGLGITLVIDSKSEEESKKFLEKFNFPFKKEDKR